MCGGEACVAGGMHRGGMHGRGTCVARGCTWQGDMHGRGGVHGEGHVWQRVCMAGGIHGGGHAWWGLCGTHVSHPLPPPDTTRYSQ